MQTWWRGSAVQIKHQNGEEVRSVTSSVEWLLVVVSETADNLIFTAAVSAVYREWCKKKQKKHPVVQQFWEKSLVNDQTGSSWQDGLQQQITPAGSSQSAKNRKQRLQMAQVHQTAQSGLTDLHFCCHMQMAGSERKEEPTDLSCVIPIHTLGPLIPTEHGSNTTPYLSIVADHVHHFMATVKPSSNGSFQQDKSPCYKGMFPAPCSIHDTKN